LFSASGTVSSDVDIATPSVEEEKEEEERQHREE
jgi:hypothetical protein